MFKGEIFIADTRLFYETNPFEVLFNDMEHYTVINIIPFI